MVFAGLTEQQSLSAATQNCCIYQFVILILLIGVVSSVVLRKLEVIPNGSQLSGLGLDLGLIISLEFRSYESHQGHT